MKCTRTASIIFINAFCGSTNVLNAVGMRESNLLKASSCVSDGNEEEKEEPNTFHVYC